MPYQPVTPTQEQLAELEAKYGNVLVMSGGKRSPYCVVLKRPSRKETIGYKAWLKKDATTASEEMVKRLAVFPDKPELDKWLEEFPFAPDFILNSDTFQDFVGQGSEADLK